MNPLPDSLFQRWTHAYEQDSGQVQVFKPEGSNLPLTRAPRQGYEFKRDGRLVVTRTGPADAPINAEGQFRRIGESKIALYFNNDRRTIIQIVHCDRNLLKIKKIND